MANIVRWRIGKNTAGGDNLQATLRLYEGTTLLQTWTRTVPDSPTTYVETITASISDRTQLRLEFEEVVV